MPFISITETLKNIKAHCIAQGKRAVIADGVACRYATTPNPSTALRCGVGALIPAPVGFNLHGTVDNSDVQAALEAEGYPVATNYALYEALQEAQGIHDKVRVTAWATSFDRLISRYEGQ